MKEKYKIINENNPEKVIGYLYKVEEDLKIRLKKDLEEVEVPVGFLLDYRKGIYEPDKLDIKYWIKTRIPRKHRLDINEILRKLNLKEYNEWELFKALKGKTIGDGIFIEKVE